MSRFLAQAGRIRTQLAGALQVDGFGVKGSSSQHGREHLQQFLVVGGESRQFIDRAALRAELSQVLNLKLRDRSHSFAAPSITQDAIKRREL
jgi:hypothetical protein